MSGTHHAPPESALIRGGPRATPAVSVPRAYEYVEAWGMAAGSSARVLRPRSLEELRACYDLAREAGLTLALRGAGCSYGDASLPGEGLCLDLRRMNRILDFDPATGIAEVEPGVTVEQLWKKILPAGWWPKVVSGTMFPTLAGALAMNIHGKNDYLVGTLGDQTLEFDLMLPDGSIRTCAREHNAELFHAAIGGFGMLGTFTRIRLRTQRVYSGELWVKGSATRDLAEMMAYFEAHKHAADYLVGWIDCFGAEENLGRGLIHHGRYLAPGEDHAPERTLRLAHQQLPERILGLFPKSEVWRILRLVNNDRGMRLLNYVKCQAGRLEGMQGWYRQPHAAFNFLLDFVPNWKWAYGRRAGHGLVQYQVFLPHERAHAGLVELLTRCQEAGIVSYLGVLKRHRPDPFWLTHAVDGWSLALDFKVTPKTRERLWAHLHTLTDRVLELGGKFYFAKDLLVRPADARRFFPADRLAAFAALKRELDPENRFATELSRRVFGDFSELADS